MKTPNRSITLLVLIGLVVTQSGEAQRTRTEPSLGDRGTAVGATLSTVADAIPATIVSTAKTTTTVTLNWSAVPGASGYTVSRVQNPTGSDRYYPLMATPLAANNVSYTDASVLPGMTYGYTVTAVRPDGHYGTSTPVSVTTLPPVNPTGFTATAGSPGEVTLTWNAATGASYYWLQGTGVQAQKVLGTTYPVRGIGPGTSEWRLIAYYEVGGQAYAEEAAPSTATLSIERTSGRYRATITGFRLNHETADAPWQGDGKGDEVYLSAFVWEYDLAQPTSLKESNPPLKTPVYGDTNGFPLRVQAGRRGDTGGLMTDDNVPNGLTPWARSEPPRSDQLPLQLWEGELKRGQKNVVVIEPVIWERDDNASVYDNWRRTGQLAANMSPDVVRAFQNALFRTGDPIDKCFRNCSWNTNTHGEQGKDRPIGLSVHPRPGPHGERIYDGYYSLDQRMVVLNFDTAEGTLQQGSSIGMKGPGVIAVQFRDQNQSGMAELNGDYTLYIQVERVP